MSIEELAEDIARRTLLSSITVRPVLDESGAERGMRAIALGQKNYPFVGSEAGGRAAAIAYTLIETAKLKGVDPAAWLADTIARIPDHKITRIDDLMPWRWTV